jgi:predicted transcriptional regulator
MERTTLMLPEDLRQRLRIMAAERGVSMATVMREALEEKVDRTRPKPKSIGVGDSGRTDLSKLAGDIRPVPRSWR